MATVVCRRCYAVVWYVNGNTLNMLTLALIYKCLGVTPKVGYEPNHDC